jgi:hypothetical protein
VNVGFPVGVEEMGIPKSELDVGVEFDGIVYQPSESGREVLAREERRGIFIFPQRS